MDLATYCTQTANLGEINDDVLGENISVRALSLVVGNVGLLPLLGEGVGELAVMRGRRNGKDVLGSGGSDEKSGENAKITFVPSVASGEVPHEEGSSEDGDDTTPDSTSSEMSV